MKLLPELSLLAHFHHKLQTLFACTELNRKTCPLRPGFLSCLRGTGFLLHIKQTGLSQQFALAGLSAPVVDAANQADTSAEGIGINLNVTEHNFWSGKQLNLSGNAVPVALSVIADTVRVGTRFDVFYPVVYPQGQTVLPRLQQVCKIVFMRHR